MIFTQQQIELAVELKSIGLPWEPAVGNYLYDATGAVKPSSPFQNRVYFLLNYDCFTTRLGGVQRFKELMTWLPTWYDARNILRALGVTDERVQIELLQRKSIKTGSELLTLYEMISAKLRENSAPTTSGGSGDAA